MKLVKYLIEIVITVLCGYCSYYLLSVVDTWEADDTLFYIFAICIFVVIGIVCIGDIIEDIYYYHK